MGRACCMPLGDRAPTPGGGCTEMKDRSKAPIDCRNLPAQDSDYMGEVRGRVPNVILARAELRKDRGEDRPAINPSFQDLDVGSCPGIPSRADFDFPPAQLWLGIDDQRPDVLPDVEHDGFGMDSVIVLFRHLATYELGLSKPS